MPKKSNLSPSKNNKVMGRISKIWKTTYLIIKAALMAFFFIYVIAVIWIIPFDILMPQHFDESIEPTTLMGRLIVGLGFLVSFLTATFYIHRYQKDLKSLLPSPPSNWKDKAKGFFTISLLTFLATAITLFVSMALGFTGFNINGGYSLSVQLFQGLEFTFIAGILTYIFVALAEEMVYRGLIFRYLLKNTSNLQLALIVSSLIFSLLHFNETPLFYVFALFLGYLIALIYYHSGSLLYCIGIHWAYDLFIFLGENYLDDYLNIEPNPISGWGYYFTLIRIIALVLIIAAFRAYMKKNKSEKEVGDYAVA